MTSPIIKLAEAPTLSFNDPDCDVCSVTVESVDDGWMCPTCGTFWDHGASEDSPGSLYEEWSGEELDLPITEPDNAYLTTISADRARQLAEADAAIERANARRAAAKAAAA